MQNSRLSFAGLCLLVASAPLFAQQDTTHHAMVSAAASTHGQVVSTTAKTTSTAHTTSVHHYTQAELQRTVKVSKDSAQVIALAKVANGTVASSELEHEHNTTVWSFDISQPHKTGYEEVLVSAVTGRVIWMGHESASHERAEQRADSAKKP